MRPFRLRRLPLRQMLRCLPRKETHRVVIIGSGFGGNRHSDCQAGVESVVLEQRDPLAYRAQCGYVSAYKFNRQTGDLVRGPG